MAGGTGKYKPDKDGDRKRNTQRVKRKHVPEIDCVAVFDIDMSVCILLKVIQTQIQTL